MALLSGVRASTMSRQSSGAGLVCVCTDFPPGPSSSFGLIRRPVLFSVFRAIGGAFIGIERKSVLNKGDFLRELTCL